MSLLEIVPPMFAVSVSTAGVVEASTVTVSVTAPRASCTFTELACSGMNWRSVRIFFWKPALSTVSVKLSAGRALKLKTPALSLVWMMVLLFALSLSVSLAPGTTAPCESVTDALHRGAELGVGGGAAERCCNEYGKATNRPAGGTVALPPQS